MIRRTSIALGSMLLLALVSASCASVNQKLNKENRALFEAPAKDKEYPAEAPFVLRAWEPGQWATYAIRNEKIWMLQTISIVGADDMGFWMEIESHDPNSEKSPSWIKIQVSGYDPTNQESIRNMQVGEMYMMQEPGGPVTAFSMPFGLANPWESVLATMKLSLQEGPGADVTVGAGRFLQTKRIDSQVEVYGFSSEGSAWFHSAIPVWGYAHQVSTDGKYESKLLKFGYEGAASKVNHRQ